MSVNPVEKFLKEQTIPTPNGKSSDTNNFKMLSIKTISKELNLKKRTAYKYCNKSNNIRKVRPIELGSSRHASNFNVFTFNH